MAVTFASAGYGGAVTQESWAKLAAQLGHSYAVDGEGSWAVAPAVGDRAISVSPGVGYGHGVRDETVVAESMFIPAVTSGSRYDLIVARRDWATKITAFAIVPGGTPKAIPARETTPGFLDEQPLALVRVTADSASVQEVVDLRVWAANGGMYAKDDLVRTYLTKIGTKVSVGPANWALQISAGTSGTATWVKESEVGTIPVFGVHGELTGGRPAADASFLVQAGTFVNTTDNAGYARLTFPKPFPNGLLSITITCGDDWSNGTIAFFSVAGRPDVFGASGFGSKSDVVYVMQGTDGSNTASWGKIANRNHRINYVAIGW